MESLLYLKENINADEIELTLKVNLPIFCFASYVNYVLEICCITGL